MAITFSTLTPASISQYVDKYPAFVATNPIACVVSGQTRFPSAAKIRHYVRDLDELGFFGLVATDDADDIYAIGLFQNRGGGIATMTYWAIRPDLSQFNEMWQGCGRHLKQLGFRYWMGYPVGEFRDRILKAIPLSGVLGDDNVWLDLNKLP